MVFNDSETRNPFNLRGTVYCLWGRSEGVTVLEAGVAFHVAWEEYAVVFRCSRTTKALCKLSRTQ